MMNGGPVIQPLSDGETQTIETLGEQNNPGIRAKMPRPTLSQARGDSQ